MRCPNASVDVLLLLAPPWPATTPLMIVTTNATADRRNTLTDMYIATPNTTRMMPTYGAMAVATPMICSAIVTSGCGGRRVGGAAGAASGSDTDLAREVILAQPAIAAVPPRGLRGAGFAHLWPCGFARPLWKNPPRRLPPASVSRARPTVPLPNS